MIPVFRDRKEPRDWKRPWKDKPGLIDCCGSGGGGTTLLVYGATSVSTGRETETYVPDTWTLSNLMVHGWGTNGSSNYTGASTAFASLESVNNWNEKSNAGGVWTNLTQAPLYKFFPCCSFLSTGTASYGYMYGGISGTFVKTNYTYDPLGDSWGTKTAMPDFKYQGRGAGISNIGYALEGIRGTGDFTPVTYAYDPVGDSWSTKTSSTNARLLCGAPTLTSAGQSEIVMAGGQSSTAIVATVNSYNTSSDAWTSRSSLVSATSNPAYMEGQSSGFIVGGLDSSSGSTNLKKTREYVIDTWTTKADVINGRNGSGGSSF